MTIAHDAKNHVERAARRPWMERAASVGFVAKGVVYALIGVFALKLAFGEGGALLGQDDAAREVKKQQFGLILLVLLGIGLACHALWSFAEAAFNRHLEDSKLKRVGKRLGALGSGLFSGFLAINAFQTANGGGGQGHRSWLHRILGADGGEWVLVAIGAGVIAFGLSQLYQAYTASFRKKLAIYEMSTTERRWIIRISRFGIAARGVVLPVAGWLLIKAGLETGERQAVGTGAALREILQQSWGEVLLAIVAAGLVAYGLYMGVNARYRRAFA